MTKSSPYTVDIPNIIDNLKTDVNAQPLTHIIEQAIDRLTASLNNMSRETARNLVLDKTNYFWNITTQTLTIVEKTK